MSLFVSLILKMLKILAKTPKSFFGCTARFNLWTFGRDEH